MPRAKSNHRLPAEFAEVQQDLSNEVRKKKEIGLVPIPGGKMVDASNFIDPQMRPGYHVSIFADPEKYLENPNPECKYVWKEVSQGKGINPRLMSGIRNRKYRLVEVEELKKDGLDLPVIQTTLSKVAGASDITALTVLDLALVEVQPKAVIEEYKYREGIAAARTVRGMGTQFFNQAAAAQGVKVDPDLLRFEEEEKTEE
jgi:hypothetical protein